MTSHRISQYEITETLYESRCTTVYRLKILKSSVTAERITGGPAGRRGRNAIVLYAMALLLWMTAFGVCAPSPAQKGEPVGTSSIEVGARTQGAGADWVSLTPEERQWLSGHDGRIRIGITVIPPQVLHGDGKHEGLAIDYIHLMERKLGCRFELVPYATWNEVIQAARLRQIDMIFAAQRTHERLAYLLFTQPYIELPNMIVVRKDRQGGSSLKNMKEWSVAVSEGSAVHEYLKNQFGYLDLRPVTDELSGLMKVSMGEVDAMVVEISRASYYIEKAGILNLRVAGNAGLLYQLRFAVRNDWPLLCGILDKGLSSITDEERRDISQRWIIVGERSIFASRVFWILFVAGLGVITLTVLGIIIWNRTLQRIVKQRTSQLQQELAKREKAEETLHHLNRELRAVSDCNQILVRAEDEQTLLNDICSIICDEAGYDLAWVGYAEHDDFKTVRIMARAGTEDKYLSTVRITWADTERGRGPAGTAIRTAEVVYIEDTVTDARLIPWREHALKRGYHSTVALPLKDETGCAFGVLVIYSLEPNAFSPDEIRLLEELAGDLAFGITVLRTRVDRKLAEDQIRHLKNYLSNVIDSMPSVLVGMDNNQTVTQWNRGAEEFTSTSATEAVGKHIAELLPDFSPWIAAMGSDTEKNRPSSIDKLLIEKEGERRFYDLMLYPLITNGVEGAVLRIEDATERIRIQELMVQTEKMMSLGGLAAGMAHEINNPLGIISQAAQNIERRVSPDLPANRKVAEELGVNLEAIRTYFDRRQIPDFIDSIREASLRASRIIINMLRFSRSAETTMQYASLSQIIDQALELAASDYDLKKKYDFKSIEIVRDYADVPEVPMVLVEIEQVMLNLLKNAAQAMDGNPPDRKPRIILRVRREDKYAVLEVEDNGPGMPEDIRRRVFEPFFTTKDPGIGTGLGLSVSYTIVTQNHKGLMEVESTPGKGTCFKVRLPLSKEDIHG
jgi:PAS domain S-box-containing protein